MMMLLKTTYAAIAFFLCTLLWLPSCSNETEIGGGRHLYTGPKIALNIQMETRDVAAPDLEIDGVRVIVFNDDGKLVHNEASTPTVDLSAGTYTVKVKAARGINHVYIICNETSELAGKLANVEAKEDIEDITFNAVGITGAPPMYGKVEDAFVEARSDGSKATVTVNGVKSDELSVAVTRMVARLGFTAIKNVDTSIQEDFTVTKISAQICHMPKETTIGEGKNYTADEWADNLLLEQEGLLDTNGAYEIDYTATPNTYTVPDDITPIVLPDSYIPENLLADRTDPSRATYLKIEAECHLKNGSTQVLRGVYLLNLGQQFSAQDYNLPRNNYFHIYATITGLGSLGIYAEIVAMEEHDITINWKPIDGLVIVSDKASDFDTGAGTSKNINVWDDYNVYSGILKTYHAETGYKDVVFKYGSLIAVRTTDATAGSAFTAPTDATDMGDILWYPASFNAPAITGWADVPYRTGDNIPEDNSENQVEQALGDPCKLVGLSEVQIRDNKIVDNLQWRMATAEQYQILIDACDNEANADGYPSFHWLLQPHATYRDTEGNIAGDLTSGHYWTTSYGRAFNFSGNTPTAAIEDADTQNAYTIRCVRNTIPASTISVVRNISVGYNGGVPSFEIASNVPYWTATLITEGKDMGNSTDFSDFSFKENEGQVHTTHGNYSQQIPAYLPRWANTGMRTFKIKAEGIGLDGNTVSTIATITQNGYEYKGTLAFDKTVAPVPQVGGNYTVTVTIAPEDIDLPAGKLWLQVLYLGTVQSSSNEVTVVPATHTYSVSLPINANNNPDMIGITVVALWQPDGKQATKLIGRDLQQKGTN